MQTQGTGPGAPSPQSAEPTVPTIVDSEERLERLEAGLERLEKELEGLQDALYRHEVLQDRSDGDLRRRTEQLARNVNVNDDARAHGP